MNNQNVTSSAPAKKISVGTILSIISIALAVLGGLGFILVYFVYPNISTILTLIAFPLLLLMYVPIVNLLPIGILFIVDFIMMWVGYLSIAAAIVGLALAMVNIFVISKETGRGLAIASAIVSGVVALAIFLVTLINTILTIIGLSLTFSAIVLLYIILLLPLIGI